MKTFQWSLCIALAIAAWFVGYLTGNNAADSARRKQLADEVKAYQETFARRQQEILEAGFLKFVPPQKYGDTGYWTLKDRQEVVAQTLSDEALQAGVVDEPEPQLPTKKGARP